MVKYIYRKKDICKKMSLPLVRHDVISELYGFIDQHIDECIEEYLPAVVADNGFVESKCLFTLGGIVLAVTFDGGKWLYEIGTNKVSTEFGVMFHNRVVDRLKERKLERAFDQWELEHITEMSASLFENGIKDLLNNKTVKIEI